MHDPQLRGQTAIITGASSGIGAAIAKRFGAAGVNVVVNYVGNEQKAAAVADEIRAAGGAAEPVQADVSKEDAVIELFRKTLEKFGALDILVANAGIQRDAPLVDMTLEEWNQVLGVNLTGQFLCIREAVKQFLKQGVREGVSTAAGKIICMSSVHQLIPWAGHVNYAASKGGIKLLMESVAQEVGGRHIRVNSIAPGAIRTPINKEVWSSESGREDLLDLIPSGRIGRPDDIAKSAAWLASDDSDYVHGATLFVDGGMTLYPGFTDAG